ncbi:MAG: TetR/AcrR family transcriptional regulator, partial [Burkholderiales bacterium]
MAYRRTHQVVRRLAARRSAILAAARETAAEGGMAAVQIIPVAQRANVAAGTVYRYFPSKADLISEVISEVSGDQLVAVRRAADAAPGPLSALAAAVTTIAVHALQQRKLAWGILAEPVDVDVDSSRISSRTAIIHEIESRIEAAIRTSHLPSQNASLTAAALVGALHEALVGPLAPDDLGNPVNFFAPFEIPGAPRGFSTDPRLQAVMRLVNTCGEKQLWSVNVASVVPTLEDFKPDSGFVSDHL